MLYYVIILFLANRTRVSELQPCKGPTKKDKNWYLVQVATGKRVQLLESGPFTLYVHDGQSCIISALEDEGTFCAGHFPKKIKPAPKDEKKPSDLMVRGSDWLKPLKGMEAKGAGWGWAKLTFSCFFCWCVPNKKAYYNAIKNTRIGLS